MTIERASDKWVSEFEQAAFAQKKADYVTLITNAAKEQALYVEDCSYFREAISDANNPPSDADIQADVKKSWWPFSKPLYRYACAAVTLFHLTDSGKLHPLAIVIDYKLSMDKSVVIFNKRISPEIPWDQEHDWPWRYAKSCAQSADWIRHEVTVHLNDCHLVEEATIVASHRTLPTDHLVYRCLQPHWLKTLALNAAARSTLVPHVVVPLIGVTAEQAYNFLNDAYRRFDWQGSYVPQQLEKRGFPSRP